MKLNREEYRKTRGEKRRKREREIQWNSTVVERQKEKRKKKERKTKKRGGKSSKRKRLPPFRVFTSFSPGRVFREEMLTRAVSRRPSKHRAGCRARGTRGIRDGAVGAWPHTISRVASHGTSLRKKFNYNLRLMRMVEGEWKKGEGIKIGEDRSRSFVRPSSLSPCQKVEG